MCKHQWTAIQICDIMEKNGNCHQRWSLKVSAWKGAPQATLDITDWSVIDIYCNTNEKAPVSDITFHNYHIYLSACHLFGVSSCTART